MIPLKEVEGWQEFKTLKETFGDVENMLKDKGKLGFVDPFYYSPHRKELYETLRQVPLREVLGGGTGSDYMSYLIPTKIYQVMLDGFYEADIMDKIAGIVIREFQGSSINLVWGTGTIKPRWMGKVGAPAISTETASRAVITPEDFGIDMQISKNMIQSSQFDLIEYHIRNGGKAMADFAVTEALKVMYADYDVTLNTVASGATNAVTTANFITARGLVEANNGGSPDTIVLTKEQVSDVIQDTTTGSYSLPFKQAQFMQWSLDGFLGMNWLPRCVATSNGLYSTSAADYYALVFQKEDSLGVAWRQPIAIENYTSPREGLIGAVASGSVGFGIGRDGDHIAAILEGD